MEAFRKIIYLSKHSPILPKINSQKDRLKRKRLRKCLRWINRPIIHDNPIRKIIRKSSFIKEGIID